MYESNSPYSEQHSFLEKDKKSTAFIIDENPHQEANKKLNIQKKIKEYIKEKKELYSILMQYFNNSDNNENYFQDLNNFICQQKQEENGDKFEEFLQIIVSICNNCHLEKSHFQKIFQIIEHYEIQIKQSISNDKIFDIFHNNKKILLFLFKKGIITIDKNIYCKLRYEIDSNGNRYSHFFYPEIKKFIGDHGSKDIERELISINPNIFDFFEEKRQEGENDTFLCSLIREDSISEFVEYVNRTNISLKSEVKSSIFETNSFLIENIKTTLIEYSAFFGSIKIFQYIRTRCGKLKPSVWLYAIHSRNVNLIHLLESLNIDPPNKDYKTCLCESIKCHHNEIADYIENNFIINDDKTRKSDEILSSILSSHNYAYFPSVFIESDEFYYLCSNNYHKLFNLFVEMRAESIEKVNSKINNNNNTALQGAVNEFEIIYCSLLTYKSIPNNCFQANQSIRKIVIPSSVTSIGDHAFYCCESLTNVTIPSSVTSIGRYAFSWCKSLANVTFPSSITSIGDYAFSCCPKLARVIIPSVKVIAHYTFMRCSSLILVAAPLVDFVEEGAFDGCKSLSVIDLSNAIRIGRESFRDCSSLEDISLPSIVKISQFAFSGCSNLTNVNLSSFTKFIGGFSFEKCISLKSISIPRTLISYGKKIFVGCYSLTKITIPNSVDVNKIGIEQNVQVIRIP
ncbi:hypothetical protein M9Y10_036730 [Tritrichomonas musculus]|uniref:Uncharacterized protein n=1 Tax=Tritrichomonas musculus TaxID=1915356 RepID=A0ABR2GTM3_9EUKA